MQLTLKRVNLIRPIIIEMRLILLYNTQALLQLDAVNLAQKEVASLEAVTENAEGRKHPCPDRDSVYDCSFGCNLDNPCAK